MTKDRLVGSAIQFVLTVAALLHSGFFIVVQVALTIGGLYEFLYLIKKKGIPNYSYTGIVIGAIIPISIFLRFEPTKNWELLFIVLALLMIFVMQLIRDENENAIVGIATTLFGVLYVSWFFSFIVRIRLLLPDVEWAGAKLVAFLIIITKTSDIGALVVGKLFGKHPLMPKISPNKTVEGSIGGFFFSAIAAVVCQSLIPDGLNFSIWQIALIGAFFGGLGQLGDLSESLIKRDCKVKDSGNMLPEIGGVLDVIDSLLFSAPAFYFFICAALRATGYGT